MSARIERVCAWCKEHLGWVDDPSGQGGVTHGICEECARKLKEQAKGGRK